MRNTLTGELPRHQYVEVDTKFTHSTPCGFVPAVWFGLVSYPGRLWGCTVMFESGAIYRNLPGHAISFPTAPGVIFEKDWFPHDVQMWDCYGSDFTTLEYRFLADLDCKVKTNGRQLTGSYLFSASPVGDAWSARPEQAKEFTFVKLDNGRLTIQPTDRIIFEEKSFTDGKLEFPRGLKRQDVIWTTE